MSGMMIFRIIMCIFYFTLSIVLLSGAWELYKKSRKP